MRILIVEDEQPAAKRLIRLIEEQMPEAEVFAVTDSVESTVKLLQNSPEPDLIFLDIQLADGLSFDIFQEVTVQTPVIFTTAYDQYTLRAFSINSLDYLLKPIDPSALNRALGKYRHFFGRRVQYDPQLLQQMAAMIHQPVFKERFLIKVGQQITYLKVAEVFYFYSEDGVTYARTQAGKRHAVDHTLDQLEELINPARFFRINRKIIVSVDAIARIAPYFNSRLILELSPAAGFEVIVSRDRVGEFKTWLDR